MGSRSILWFALILAIVLGALWQFVPLKDAKERMEVLPLRGIGYQGKDVPLDGLETAIFKNVNVLKRSYTVGNKEYFVTILDGTKDRHLVHDPYYCFTGTGWKVSSEKQLPTERGSADALQLTKGENYKEALFWFSDGNSHYAKPLFYWMQTAYRRLTLGASGPEPILIIVQAEKNERIDWETFKRDFSALFSL